MPVDESGRSATIGIAGAARGVATSGEGPPPGPVTAEEASLLDSMMFATRVGPACGLPLCAGPRIEPGARCGSYRIIRQLARGGQARVYLAEDERLCRQVAIKVLSRAAGDDTFLERFRREARTAARLTHPGICTVHEAGIIDGAAYIVMRYLDGQTLAALLADRRGDRRPPLAPAAATRLIERVARAVHVAHESGIVHRDLKPANVMMVADGKPVVLDFGLALEVLQGFRLTQTGLAFGTPAYLAPEQIDPSIGPIDRRTDVYALGVCLHECLCGQRPFEHDRLELLYRKILTEHPPRLRELVARLPRDLSIVVRTALEKEPDRRYQTAHDMAEDLVRVRRRRPIRARPTGQIRRTARWVDRNRALAATVGGIIATLVIGLVVTATLLALTEQELTRLAARADLDRVHKMVAAADDFAGLPLDDGRMPSWIADAEEVLARRGAHRARLAALRRSGRRGAGGEWTFDDLAKEEEHEQLTGLLVDLARLEALAAEAEANRARNMQVRLDTVAEKSSEWEDARARIRSSPLYGGMDIEPQFGLVPLGPDPVSGLMEFGHPQTGDVPSRHPDTGVLQPTETSGLVFVLVPAGSFDMGARPPSQEHPAGSPNVDPGALADERPVRTVRLDAFFISKYEMTQGQWRRVAADDPSRWHPGSDAVGSITLRHPVESVSWRDCWEALGRLGLLLPTEAQWEYAARAGTTTPWWTGAEATSLLGAVNLADQAAWQAGEDGPATHDLVQLDDGWVEHAPVGLFRPNPFGLHDVAGNVWEYTRDHAASYEIAPRSGDGLRVGPEHRGGADAPCGDGERVTRGGGFYEGHLCARSARRYLCKPDGWTFSSGVRPSRAIDPRPDYAAPEARRR